MRWRQVTEKLRHDVFFEFLQFFHFPFFAARRSRLDFGFGPFAGRSDANPPAFGAIPQHLPVVEYFIPFRL